MLRQFVGQYVICRSLNEGINAGLCIACDEHSVFLENARRLWSHAPADQSLSWYEGVALSGLHPESKVSAPVEKLIREDYSLTLCTAEARKSIEEFPSMAQS